MLKWFGFERGAQGFDGERRRVLFARGQATKRARNVPACQACGFFNGHPLDHLHERRTARQRGRATVGEEAHSFDPPIAQPQRETQPVTAHRVKLFGDGVRLLKLPDMTRIC